MINSINKIYGIGKYYQYDGVVPMTKNQVFFGFNGSSFTIIFLFISLWFILITGLIPAKMSSL